MSPAAEESGASCLSLPPSVCLPALPSSVHKMQVPGRPLICFAVQKAQATGFLFLFPCLKLKWGSVSRQEGRGGGRGRVQAVALQKRSLRKAGAQVASGGLETQGTQGLWGGRNPCLLITEIFWCTRITLFIAPTSALILYSFSSLHVLLPSPQLANQWKR